ncbi:MAG TPA: imidazole glycerol phosphate synthase subunit HisH [Puia sp.]|jgi:glutamine amidotransferase|nr:imidazole glycerol phosphate synthase subunit HisH [Puia sp.]
MSIAIVKYNAGNIQSVLYALERIGKEAIVTDDQAQIRAADKVIFPGVGEASTAMEYLKERGLDTLLRSLQQPVLGICLGMQLMCRYSEENDTECLGIFEEEVKKFVPPAATAGGSLPGEATTDGPVFKVPQIGWNNIYHLQSPLFQGIPENSYCYFVHGYYAALGEHTIATTDYVQPYSSALHKGNFYGVQFHPEKSAQVGEQLLRNFLEWK